MRQKFPKSFYFKLIFIIVVLIFTYFSNRSYIDATLADDSLTNTQSFAYILQEILGFQPATEPNQPTTITTNNQTDNSQPRQMQSEIVELDNYQYAIERANVFNSNVDLTGLNQAFTELINNQRINSDWNPIEVGYHLQDGTNQRALELSENHYLSPMTLSGEDFRTLFDNIPNGQYRLGENLYELYISANDIHLDTWSNPDILANYLFEVFEHSSLSDLYQNYQSQYLSVHANASDYSIDSASYVRLVVVLVLDTQTE